MPILTAFTVANTNNVDQMASVLTDVYDARKFETKPHLGAFLARASFFDFGNSNLSYCSYGAPTLISFRDDKYWRLQLAIDGCGETLAANHSAEVNADTLVCSPADADLRFGNTFRQLVLRIDADTLERDLQNILGTRPKARLTFDLSSSASNPQTKRLRDLIVHASRSIDAAEVALPRPLLRELDQTMRIAMLYGIANNHSDLLHSEQKTSAPWQVKIVEEWIDAHWREDVTIDDLCRLTGTGARSIFASFKKSRGYSPIAYLKTVRLQAARAMLTSGDPNVSVTGIAYACGFTSLGHFARYYRTQFGELPSETIQRGRTGLRGLP